MTRSRTAAVLLLAAPMMLSPLVAEPLVAQAAAPAPAAAPAFRAEFLDHFDMSMQKFIALAEAMPADRYTWSPGEGVMEVGHVFMHVARYNYGYPSENMGVAAPQGVDLDAMESVRDKATVVRTLRESAAYVRNAVNGMSDADMAKPTRLYGRDVAHWSVLLQLLAHMNEHLGQSIAYARMNSIVPPWSQ